MRLVAELSDDRAQRSCFIEYGTLEQALSSVQTLAQTAPCDFTVHGIHPFDHRIEVHFTLGLSDVSWSPKGIKEEAAFIAASGGLGAGS